jgi:hypothetical protein
MNISIEQYAAITSSIFAGITLWLAFKTKSLTDVVKEMKIQTMHLIEQNAELAKQTTVLAKSYELQYQLTLTERIPYFKSGNFQRNSNNIEGSLSLTNFGQPARKVFLLAPARRERDITFTGSHNFEHVIKSSIVTFYFTTIKEVREFKFDFVIRFINEDGNEFFQEFILSEEIVVCYPPSMSLGK